MSNLQNFISWNQIIEEKEYRERIIKFFRLPMKLSVSKEKFISDLEFMSYKEPEKFSKMVCLTVSDFNKMATEQKTDKPDFSMEEVLKPLLEDIESTKEWQDFLEKDYSDVLENYEGITNVHDFYTKENDGKYLLSIDLEAANWQSLQRIVGLNDSYEDTIKKYTTNLIPPISKTFRTKVSGILGSKKITDYNKKILFDNKENLLNALHENTNIDLRNKEPLAFYADEFIMEIDKEIFHSLLSMDISQLEKNLYDITGVKVHIRPFQLRWMNLNKGAVKFTKDGFEILNLNKDVLLIVNKIIANTQIKDIDFESIKLKDLTKEEFIQNVKESLVELNLI